MKTKILKVEAKKTQSGKEFFTVTLDDNKSYSSWDKKAPTYEGKTMEVELVQKGDYWNLNFKGEVQPDTITVPATPAPVSSPQAVMNTFLETRLKCLELAISTRELAGAETAGSDKIIIVAEKYFKYVVEG